MKKLLAVLLAIICAFTAVSMTAFAGVEDMLGGIIEDQFGITQEEDEMDAITYGIYYDVSSTTVSVYYKPTHNLRFDVPTEVTLSEDTPIAVDHNWIAWRDKETGKLYYPGDKVLVTGKVTLVAVWEEKTDNYPGFIRTAIAGLQAFVRLIDKFLGAFDAINDTKPIETTTEVA